MMDIETYVALCIGVFTLYWAFVVFVLTVRMFVALAFEMMGVRSHG